MGDPAPRSSCPGGESRSSPGPSSSSVRYEITNSIAGPNARPRVSFFAANSTAVALFRCAYSFRNQFLCCFCRSVNVGFLLKPVT
jgi:hypothetical protein